METVDNVALPAWRCIAASVRGIGHERAGLPCQDAHGWRLIGPGAIAAVVADGAGSASLSEIGAGIACTAALDSIAASVDITTLEAIDDWGVVLSNAVADARSAVEAEAERLETVPRELACTLILAVGTPTSMSVAQIGDGATVVRSDTGELIAVSSPQSGEYLNETVFLTSAGSIPAIEVWYGCPAQFALFTDGLQTIALSAKDGAPHAPFFEPLFRFACSAENAAAAELQLAEFLKSPRFEQRTDDDLTLLLAVLN